MLVELGKYGTIINITKGGEVRIKLESGELITKDEVLLNLPVSVGDELFTFNNNFLIAGEKSLAKE